MVEKNQGWLLLFDGSRYGGNKVGPACGSGEDLILDPFLGQEISEVADPKVFSSGRVGRVDAQVAAKALSGLGEIGSQRWKLTRNTRSLSQGDEKDCPLLETSKSVHSCYQSFAKKVVSGEILVQKRKRASRLETPFWKTKRQ